jgi:neutral ceramidase
VTRVAFEAPDGPIAELLIASAHPTTAGREGDTLDADWPGAVAALREAEGSGVTLVVQGAAGNASVAFREGEAPAAWASRLVQAAKAVPLRSAGDKGLVLVRVGVTLPEVDASRLVTGALQPATRNVLCTQSDAYVTVSLARLGALTLLAIPGEPSFAAGRTLEEKGGADRVVSLAGGYLGYVEAPELVLKGEGESKRQYYGPGLQAALEDGARTAFEAMALMLQPPRPLPGQEPAPQ